jgi:uncharacterized membrane protein YcgQ (UPF0703/DUF1980 family)
VLDYIILSYKLLVYFFTSLFTLDYIIYIDYNPKQTGFYCRDGVFGFLNFPFGLFITQKKDFIA